MDITKIWKLANSTWPGLDQLNESAQVGLVSVVFNRGTSTKGPSRIEMLNIKPLVLKKDYLGIAREIRSMKRLWANKKLDGLIKRREEEAKLVEASIET